MSRSGTSERENAARNALLLYALAIIGGFAVVILAFLFLVSAGQEIHCQGHRDSCHPSDEQTPPHVSMTTDHGERSYRVEYYPQEQHKEEWAFGLTADQGLAWLTFLLVVGTVALAVYTARLFLTARDEGRENLRRHRKDLVLSLRALKETQRANRIAIDTREAQLRAYITSLRASLSVVDGEDIYHVKIRVRNTGLTPAYLVHHDVEDTVSELIEPDLPFPKLPVSLKDVATYEIGPRQRRTIDHYVSFHQIETTQPPYDARHASFFVFGSLFYQDAFDNIWRTDFTYSAGFEPEGGLMLGRMHEHHKGNRST